MDHTCAELVNQEDTDPQASIMSMQQKLKGQRPMRQLSNSRIGQNYSLGLYLAVLAVQSVSRQVAWDPITVYGSCFVHSRV